MYLKKNIGVRAVTMPDGTILTRGDLPAADTRRWVASRKMVVVMAVEHGLATREEVLTRYDLSPEEFDIWIEAVHKHGARGLKVTAIQKFRQL